MSSHGTAECIECGREFDTEFEDGSYEIGGYTKTEHWPEHDTCPFCRGLEECSEEDCREQATVFDKEGGDLYCAHHWEALRKGSDCTKEEWEEFCVRLDPAHHASA